MMVVCMLSIVALVAINLVRDWVAEDIQNRLWFPVVAMVVPFVIVLLAYAIREFFKPRRHGN
jgi:hypothetical protein